MEQSLVLLQKKIAAEERPGRTLFRVSGGSQGTQAPILVDGKTKSRDPRGPGMEGSAIRGTSESPPIFWESRSDLMWTPPPRRIELVEPDRDVAELLKTRFVDAVDQATHTSDMLTFTVRGEQVSDVLRFLKTEATPRFRRLEDLTAVDESLRRDRDAYPDITLARPVTPPGWDAWRSC